MCFHLKRQQRLNLNKSLVGETSRKMMKGIGRIPNVPTKPPPGGDSEAWLGVPWLFSPPARIPILNRFASQGFCSVFTQFIHLSPLPGFLTHSTETGAILYDMAMGIFFLLEEQKGLLLTMIFSSWFPPDSQRCLKSKKGEETCTNRKRLTSSQRGVSQSYKTFPQKDFP